MANRVDLDLTDMTARLDWLTRDVRHCEEQLREIEHGNAQAEAV